MKLVRLPPSCCRSLIPQQPTKWGPKAGKDFPEGVLENDWINPLSDWSTDPEEVASMITHG